MPDAPGQEPFRSEPSPPENSGTVETTTGPELHERDPRGRYVLGTLLLYGLLIHTQFLLNGLPSLYWVGAQTLLLFSLIGLLVTYLQGVHHRKGAVRQWGWIGSGFALAGMLGLFLKFHYSPVATVCDLYVDPDPLCTLPIQHLLGMMIAVNYFITPLGYLLFYRLMEGGNFARHPIAAAMFSFAVGCTLLVLVAGIQAMTLPATLLGVSWVSNLSILLPWIISVALMSVLLLAVVVVVRRLAVRSRAFEREHQGHLP